MVALPRPQQARDHRAARELHRRDRGADTNANQTHFVRATAPLGPQSLSFLPRSLGTNRANAYGVPGVADRLASGLPVYDSRQCGRGDPIPALIDPADIAPPPALVETAKNGPFAERNKARRSCGRTGTRSRRSSWTRRSGRIRGRPREPSSPATSPIRRIATSRARAARSRSRTRASGRASRSSAPSPKSSLTAVVLSG